MLENPGGGGELLTHYETLLISQSSLDKEDIGKLIDKTNHQITKSGGKPVRTTEWGVKKLAYEIKKQREGYYILFEFTGEKDAVRSLEDYLNLQGEVLRYLTTLKKAKRTRA